MVNLHLTVEDAGFEHLISQLKEDGENVEKTCDDKGNILFVTLKECRVFLNAGVVSKAVIHDPTYSRTYFRAQNPVS